MAITGSPDVFVSEQDLSTYVGNMDVTTAAIAGDFLWGPAGEAVRVSDEARLKAYFGGPVDRNYKDWYTAKNYLEYSNSLAVSRVVLDSAQNAYFIPQPEYIPQRLNPTELADAGEDGEKFPWKVADGYAGKIASKLDYDTQYQQYLLSIGEYTGSEGTDAESVADEVARSYNERVFYTPITEDKSVRMTEDTAIANATVTNFPNYVAYCNSEGAYAIGKATRQLFEDYEASPQNLMDLVPLNGGYAAGTGGNLTTIKEETIDSIGICSVIACYNKPREGEKKVYFYLRKKFLGKFYKIVCLDDTVEDEAKEYVIKFIGGTGTNKYALEGFGMNWGYKFAEENMMYSGEGTGGSDIILYVESGTFKLHVNNDSDYTVQEQAIGSNSVLAMAKYPGAYGNRIHVSIINKPAYDAYKKAVTFNKPGLVPTDPTDADAGKSLTFRSTISSLTSIAKNRVIDYIGANKEFEDDSIAVAVFLWDEKFESLALKEYGIFSLTPGSLDITGYDNYVFNWFNKQSNYVNLNKIAFNNVYIDPENPLSVKAGLTGAWINIDADLAQGVDYDPTRLGGNDALYSDVTTTNSNGVDYDVDSTATTVVMESSFIKDYTPIINLVGGVGAYKKAWDVFRNEEADNTQVQLLMQGGGSPEIGQYIIDLAEKRKDCLACVSPALSECVNVTDPCDRIAAGTGKYYSKSSYVYMDGNYKYQYDTHNDCYRWMPLNGDTAGLFAYIDAAEDPWMSIGGRQIRNCIKLAFYPSKADRDVLFNAGVNAVTNFSNEGNVIWGDWTRLSNSAFNFVGVRRCFLYVERNIIQYARKIMWKQNDTLTRDQFVLAITPFLDSVVGGRGAQEYGIYAGEDVTSPDEMDRGIFRAKIAIKPVRSIRYVDLVFAAVRSDMSISEVID